MRNLAVILPLQSKFFENFRRFNAIDESIEMLKNSWISKNFKTFLETHTANRLKEII